MIIDKPVLLEEGVAEYFANGIAEEVAPYVTECLGFEDLVTIILETIEKLHE